MKKAGVMAQARKEPRFAEIELLTPAKPAGASARLASVDEDISDADFETVQPLRNISIRTDAARPLSHSPVQGLGLLRQNVRLNAASFASDDQLSPGFLAITLILALTVFWLCGGHALLY
jgi:hypothetical protein